MERDKLSQGAEKPLKNLTGAITEAERMAKKASIIRSIETITKEMVTIAALKIALVDYFKIEDVSKSDDTFYWLLGGLEMSLIRRKQMLDEEQKALVEYG